MSDRVNPKYLWFNGEIVPWEQATLHATDTIWSSIHTVFEGIRAYWNAEAETIYVFRLREHLRRLEQSMRLIRLPSPYPPMRLLDDLPALLQRNEVREDTYIRVVSFPTERRMASQADEEVPNLLADTAPYPSHLHEDDGSLCRHLMVSSYTRISDPSPYHVTVTETWGVRVDKYWIGGHSEVADLETTVPIFASTDLSVGQVEPIPCSGTGCE